MELTDDSSGEIADALADLASRSEVLAVLTPEQRAEAAELRGGRERRMEERRARRGNR
ncbi:MAG: hypothetical protein QGI02_10965 [Vicinamibacterales bacterium]|nr:hypothetical protein [Vicinamibacterales bacterium]